MSSRLPQVFRRLGEGLQTGNLYKLNSKGQFKRGKPVKTFDDPVEVSFFTIPDGDNTFKKKAEENGQIVDNRWFYFEDYRFDVKEKYVIEYDSVFYEIDSYEGRIHGNFTVAHGSSVQRADVVQLDSSGA